MGNVRLIAAISAAAVLVACTSEGESRSVSTTSAPATSTPAASAPATSAPSTAGTTPASEPPPVDARVRPNIVLVTADDMRPDDLDAMPFVRDELAKSGVTFTDAISPYPLCCPARATILTGQYSHNHRVRSNKWPNGSYWTLTGLGNTLPVWLQQAGYRTAMVGKFLNWYEFEPPSCEAKWCRYLEGRQLGEVPPGWNRWHAMVGDEIYSYRRVDLLSKVGDAPAELTSAEEYHTTALSAINDEVIDEFAAGDAPFFLWYSSITPHNSERPYTDEWFPPVAEHRYEHDFDGVGLPDSQEFTEAYDEDTSDKAGPMADLPPFTPDQHVRMRTIHEQRLESLRSLDDSVERLVDSLRDNGELDDTVIIFTSDNGFSLGEHRRPEKDQPYESALRVPMIIRGPGLAGRYQPGADEDAAVESPSTVTTVDIPATVVALSGARAGRALDGLDITRPEANPDFGGGDRAVLIESGNNNTDRRSPLTRFIGVRTNRWTWFGWDALPIDVDGDRTQSFEQLQFNARGRFRSARELYDRDADPAQVDNLQGVVDPELAGALEQTTREHFDCAGTECIWTAPVG